MVDNKKAVRLSALVPIKTPNGYGLSLLGWYKSRGYFLGGWSLPPSSHYWTVISEYCRNDLSDGQFKHIPLSSDSDSPSTLQLKRFGLYPTNSSNSSISPKSFDCNERYCLDMSNKPTNEMVENMEDTYPSLLAAHELEMLENGYANESREQPSKETEKRRDFNHALQETNPSLNKLRKRI
ncbi:hypothetical protein O6H91_03G077900 [Diphasiastrum complanatum]|uniref:Uncharacterized protein n=1 Tax=Diphasiastrum complanatum TaxID=34168 RepID=A0ACC2E836_DIPCM|nr:hypothetical protein O6H91_03G077900 [Diphasiastrum complanatum]